ncbi:MAG: enoyl-CoA hydratase-related protein [Eubacteriales bacterium]|nr:enoyl-CoA hydratase-related protein [Clostridiales bacterium]MDY2597611.1 enoyl-CoA hydratase-related protein [Eubacteriales bacterium]MDD6018192.1 enoyl-CoA hydratase-related protein [Clostridiales bacterium]MDD7523048.1 enoyl-CoA hydratase-related protein [Clostridiales bacterium]MDY3309163.1 enoyl-CoA hydratase-related protein [Eubacteriales bacterium]
MLLYEKKGAVGILTVNRPEALNAINSALLDELYDKVSEIAADESVRCLILTGSGKAFVAGADIGEMKDLSKQEGYEFGMRGHRSFTAVENLEIPVIAAVNGYALGGGCELALCADIRIASERAKFAQPEVGLGITPGFGGTQRLIRTVNRAKAMEMILTARTVSAQEALEMGLVSRVVPGEELMNTALALAEAIAANAPVAVRNAKAAVRRSYARELNEDLEAEAKLFADCFETEDQRMAMTAFVNKTPKTEFKGK